MSNETQTLNQQNLQQNQSQATQAPQVQDVIEQDALMNADDKLELGVGIIQVAIGVAFFIGIYYWTHYTYKGQIMWHRYSDWFWWGLGITAVLKFMNWNGRFDD